MNEESVLGDYISEPFESYVGQDPYIFISYAHRDKEVVYQCLDYLNNQNINIWYDEGIPPSAEWVEEIAQAIKTSSLFVLFMSPHALASRYVINEINYAVSLNKNILTIYLEETMLSEGLSLCLQPFQSLETSLQDWQSKASDAIKSQIIQVNSDNLIEFDSDSSALASTVNLGVKLWEMWGKAMTSQNSRHVKNHGLTEVSFDSNKDKSYRHLDEASGKRVKPGKNDKTFSGRTRHPWAINVNVKETENPELEKKSFEDENAGSMIWIPPGEISIWVPYAEESRLVHVKNGFWMGKFPVTQHVYQTVMGLNPSFSDSPMADSGKDLPVNNVSWLEAVSFCKALTILGRNTGNMAKNLEFRLPSEVEWEYACRAGTATTYYFGDDPNELHYHAWYKVNSEKSIHPVGQKSPNPWGIHDLYGNVREWVGKSFANTLLNDNEQDEFRISRGGGYMKAASECKSSSRSTNSLHHRYRNLGFRLVLAKLPKSVK